MFVTHCANDTHAKPRMIKKTNVDCDRHHDENRKRFIHQTACAPINNRRKTKRLFYKPKGESNQFGGFGVYVCDASRASTTERCGRPAQIHDAMWSSCDDTMTCVHLKIFGLMSALMLHILAHEAQVQETKNEFIFRLFIERDEFEIEVKLSKHR